MTATGCNTGARTKLGGHGGVRRCLAFSAALVALLVAAPAAGAVTWTLQSAPAPQSANSQFFSVSCASSTACTGVGFSIDPLGEQRPMAAGWNGTSWTAQTVPPPTGFPIGHLHGVSCTSASACIAVGGVGFSDFPSAPLAERWNGAGWTVQAVPNPSGITQVVLQGVSCTSATVCSAVGTGQDSSSHSVAVAERWNGTSWTAQTIPEPAGTTAAIFNGISCSGAGFCVAVGGYSTTPNAFSPSKTLAERWNGTTWTVQTTPNPAGATAARFDGVSCSANTACTAVGGFSTTSSLPGQTLAERFNGTNWTIQTTPNPAFGTPTLSGVSCPTATACTAVGAPAEFASAPLVEQWNGTTWTIQSAPSPAGTSSAQFSGVSCTAATACTAVGGAGAGIQVPPSTLAERGNGSSWTIQTTPNRAGALVSELNGDSCPTASSCIAVGDFVRANGQLRMLAEGWNGTTWTNQTIVGPSTTNGSLKGVSCTSATACTAVGSYVNPSFAMVSLADRWNGSNWVQQSTPNPSTASSTVLRAVSCASATSCMAVGSFFNSGSNHWELLAEQWNGTSWSIKTTPNPAGATFGTLNGVSCTSLTACTAVGGYSTTSPAFRADKLVAEQWNGTSWSIKTTPSPAGTTFATFTGVSCSAATACTAAGGFSTSPGDSFPRRPLAARWNGTSWSIQTTTNPASTGFTGDSCPAATACTAVGEFFAEGWNGTTWTTQTLAFPPMGSPEPFGVACSAATDCTAVGRTVPNYLIALIFANSAFVRTMTLPLVERDPASPGASAASRGPAPSPRQTITVIRRGSSAPQLAVLSQP